MSETKTIVDKINLREQKGKLIAESRKIFRIIGKDVFYVESENVDDMVYYIMFNTEKDFCWCSCLDHSVRNIKMCKHLYAVEYAIRKGTVQDTDKLPSAIKKDNSVQLQYTKDVYSF